MSHPTTQHSRLSSYPKTEAVVVRLLPDSEERSCLKGIVLHGYWDMCPCRYALGQRLLVIWQTFSSIAEVCRWTEGSSLSGKLATALWVIVCWACWQNIGSPNSTVSPRSKGLTWSMVTVVLRKTTDLTSKQASAFALDHQKKKKKKREGGLDTHYSYI